MFVGVGAMASANAADIYQRGGTEDEPAYMPAITWSGFYVGFHAGGAWGSDRVTDVDAWFLPAGRHFNVDDRAFIGGGEIGYNIQRGSLVLGIEGELGYLGLDKHMGDPGTGGRALAQAESDLYGTLTGRIGLVSYRWLIYAKGGAAFVNADFSYSDSPFLGAGTISDLQTGWVVGGGVEYALSRNWSMKAEYLHFDFGSATARADVLEEDGTAVGPPLRFKNDLTVDSVIAGINYRFGSDYQPLK